MEVKYIKNEGELPNFPYVTRHHIYPGNIIIGFLIPICSCPNQKNNGYDYCETCGCAIPTEKEKNGQFENKGMDE